MKERGCGKRAKGGLYACCGLSPFGKPIEDFLIDPPIAYNGESFRAPIVDEKNGVKNLIFWVGKEYYPFCPDYIEETRVMGISKRVPLGFDFDGIEPFKSSMFFIHPRAIIDNDIWKPDWCPMEKDNHIEGDEFCIRSLYFFVDVEIIDGKYVRRIASTSYTVPISYEHKPEYKPGIFMRIPFSHFEYVAKDDGTVDERVKDIKSKTGLSVLVVDE